MTKAYAGRKNHRTRTVRRQRDALRPKPPTLEEWQKGLDALAQGGLTAEELFARIDDAEPHPGLRRR